MKVFGNIYKRKKVLVIGHTGFKGSWLIIWLKLLGANIAGYSLYEHKKPNHFEKLKIKKKIKHYKKDIRDIDSLKEVIYDFKPEIIFNLAAQPIVSESYVDPVLTYSTNVMGLVNLLQIVKETSFVKNMVLITSDKAYFNDGRKSMYKENDLLFGEDPYSASKSCSEIVANSFYKSFYQNSNCHICTVRAGNVIGGGDWAKNRLVPDLFRNWTKNKIAEIRNPNSTRPWQHVLEPIGAYLLVGKIMLERKKNLNGQSFNFGPKSDQNFSVNDLVKLFQVKWKNRKFKVLKRKSKFKEEKLLRLSNKKAKDLINWCPVLNKNQFIEFTLQWYKDYPHNNTFKYSSEQIYKYLETAKERKLKWIK